MKVTPNLVVPTWIMIVGIVGLSVPAPGITAGVLIFAVTVLIIPILLTVFLSKRPG